MPLEGSLASKIEIRGILFLILKTRVMDSKWLFRKLASGTKFNAKYKDDTRRNDLQKSHKINAKDYETNSFIACMHESNKEELKRNFETQLDHVEDNRKKKIKLSETSDLKLEKNSTFQIKKKLKKRKNFSKIKEEQINHFRKQNGLHVYGSDIPGPVSSFEQLLSEYQIHYDLLSNIQKMDYKEPTPIQMQAIPLLLYKREILACAPTGSGKTAAFLIPIIHDLKEPSKGGIRALVVSPTRELAEQIYRECLRLSEGTRLRVCISSRIPNLIKKHGDKFSKRFDILITTPNKVVYLLKSNPSLLSLKCVQWLIIDESDKLFEDGKQGFRDQLAVIYKACDSGDVRRAMFSATYTYEVEEWCKLNLDNLVIVSVGQRNSAVELVDQQLLFVGSESGKVEAFRNLVKKGLTPPVLVFVQSKERAKELFAHLIHDNVNVAVIHSDCSQEQRNNIVKSFRLGKIWVLICTELMARGIDFKAVNLVINFDFPQSAISYIHRIGRTGRAGRSGAAITFFTEDDAINLRSIAQIIADAGCKVPDYVMQMKKPSKHEKRKLSKYGLKRKSISAVPWDEVKRHKKRNNSPMKKHSKLKTHQKTIE